MSAWNCIVVLFSIGNLLKNNVRLHLHIQVGDETSWGEMSSYLLKPKLLELENDQNVMLNFSWIISLVWNKDADTEVIAPASVFTIVLSCLDCQAPRQFGTSSNWAQNWCRSVQRFRHQNILVPKCLDTSAPKFVGAELSWCQNVWLPLGGCKMQNCERAHI